MQWSKDRMWTWTVRHWKFEPFRMLFYQVGQYLLWTWTISCLDDTDESYCLRKSASFRKHIRWLYVGRCVACGSRVAHILWAISSVGTPSHHSNTSTCNICLCGTLRAHGSPSISVLLSETAPKTPPCIVTILIAASWLPLSVAPQQSSSTKHSKPRSFASRIVVDTHTSVVMPQITKLAIPRVRKINSKSVAQKLPLPGLSIMV